jgi:SAM-dependent methyltransferase
MKQALQTTGMGRFATHAEYAAWVEGQSWYQTIELPSGLKTSGSVQTQHRTALLQTIDFKGKRVLDIGCNSGQYCLMAKAAGASDVVGIDIDDMRLEQGRILAANEGLDVTFTNCSLGHAQALGTFDIVFCFAVLTEIPDLFGAIESLKSLIGGYALIEMDCAHRGWVPFNPKLWFKKNKTGLPLRTAMAEIRKTKRGYWILHPSFALLKEMFGPEFQITKRGKGVRYDLYEIKRRT